MPLHRLASYLKRAPISIPPLHDRRDEAPREIRELSYRWGSADILRGRPALREYKNAIYQVGDDWGVYSDTGLGVAGAMHIEGRDSWGSVGGVKYEIDQRMAYEIRDEPPMLPGSYIYAGRINIHFGHFIFETLPRLWWLMDRGLRPGEKILMHGPPEFDWQFGLPHVSTLLQAAGVRREDVIVLDQAATIERLIVPDPAARMLSYAFPAFGELTRRIGATLLNGRSLEIVPRPVYLSKTRLTEGVARSPNEPEIVEILEAEGVEIIHPQELSLADQVALFAARRTIMGLAGSAFHVALFAPPSARLICICGTHGVNANFILADKLNDNRATYLYQGGTIVEAGGPDFLSSIVFPEPKAIAYELLRRAS